jgi:predicted RNase H-like HicB family nuclease
MELAIRIQVEELPEGLYLATSEELPGLVAQGRTVAQALDIAREGLPALPAATERRDFTIVVAA